MAAKTRRFRVALSFPGEHRERVEKIAEALGDRLGREKVLYDRFFPGEFARPDLDLYLPRLYHDDSDLVVYFLCKEYDEKEWCGLEWRAGRDLLKRKMRDRLMFLRLDNAEIPGLLSIDGYLDIREMADFEVAAAILSRIGDDRPGGLSYRAFTGKLPGVNPTLIGREEQIALLDRAWADPAANVIQVIAAGGTGKTALVDKWFRRHLGEVTIFGWSFYSQGSSVDRQTSSDPFFTDLIKWFGIKVAPSDSIYIKAEAIARRLRDERVLLLLDGVEPLQDSSGYLRDLPLKALLQELATGHRGLAVCTTRVQMDLPEAIALDLDNLTPEQGAEYLRSLKVEGTDEELRQASREYWNHALALTLLGTYLVDFCDADIRRRIEIPELMEPDSHAHRVIAAYERMFAGKPELDILHALGCFDRPAEPEALKLVLSAMEDRKYRGALNRLHAARLILTTDPTKEIDCHPLVREHFAKAATQEGHERLYEHYTKQGPHRPDTLEEMAPLFYAVYHGCKAGRHQGAFDDIYWDRISRCEEQYIWRGFGAHGTNLSLLANFFETPWTQPVPALRLKDQIWAMGAAGYSLRSVVRLEDAVKATERVAKAAARLQDWKTLADAYSKLCGLQLNLGNIAEAVKAASLAVELADRSGEISERIAARADLADTLHQAGEFAEAGRFFKEWELLETHRRPEDVLLYAVYFYCDLLLDLAKTAEVISRASQSLKVAEKRKGLLDIGRAHLWLGRAHPAGSPEGACHLDRAVDFLRRAGSLHRLPLALLARGTPRDRDEVFRIATRSGMRLFLADYHLAEGNLAEAEALINATGYHRRDRELAELRARKANA
jgi:tetratricopeptide (TPR) repeat protein